MKKERKSEKGKKSRKIWKWVGWIGVVLMLIGVVIGFLVWWNMEGVKSDLERRGLPNRGVPVMEILLADGLELSEIDDGSKETKYEGNEVIVYEDGEATEYSDVEVKGRGNTTWTQEKKPYQLKFDKKVNLFGHKGVKKTVLLSCSLDPSFLRNDIAFILAEMIGMKYNKVGKFVELYIDGDYKGLYYLVDKIEISKESVDVRNEESVLVEIDMIHRKEHEKCYKALLEECIIFKDSYLKDANEDKIMRSFLEDLDKTEESIMRGDYREIIKRIDTESFAEYFLIKEFAVDPDAYSSSFYMYRGCDGKIGAGPVWDFDLAFANIKWDNRKDNFFSPNESMVRKKEAIGYDGYDENKGISKIIYYLMEIPEFQEEVKRVFQEKMSGRGRELVQKIVSRMEEVYWAVKADEEKWEREDFEEGLTELVGWIQARYKYFEEIYGGNSIRKQGVI